MLHIGTAGWTIPKDHAVSTPRPGSHLERYARVFPCCEINSSFHRSHRAATWRRWAEAVPADFRFAVKLPKTLTHVAKLAISPDALDPFFSEVAGLGDRLGPLLVQLPPSLRFEDCPAAEFFEMLRARTEGPVALEPRHTSWFSEDVSELLKRHKVSRVIADPPRHAHSDLSAPLVLGGFQGLAYFRLHGSPRTYYSTYEQPFLDEIVKRIKELPRTTKVWMIFDNTALGGAFQNAKELQQMLDKIVV